MHFVYKFEAMSTPCELHLYTEEKNKADTTAKKVLEEAKRLEKKYNYFSETSLLSQLNQRTSSKLDTETKTLLQQAKHYYAKTEGIFDVTVATFKDLYKETKDSQTLKRKKEILKPYVGCEHFSIKRDKLVFDNPHTKIDLGGFVKEYAVDRAVQLIKKSKINSALVSFGGDVYALGRKPNGKHFKIGISNPAKPQEALLYQEIENQALTTSGSYERFYTIEEQNYSHILSKSSSDKEMPRSVTVISPTCLESGVYSTALMLNPDLKTKHQTIML
ncbi:MAG TPA: FAD:protein FMN transferase [Campylobacterales bacterium]|nr:FAD:protein FMN transferase [Campylobacterales bacterium]HHS92976.1 FAD:protein FMN transferase [Campylobacterales bacterium]